MVASFESEGGASEASCLKSNLQPSSAYYHQHQQQQQIQAQQNISLNINEPCEAQQTISINSNQPNASSTEQQSQPTSQGQQNINNEANQPIQAQQISRFNSNQPHKAQQNINLKANQVIQAQQISSLKTAHNSNQNQQPPGQATLNNLATTLHIDLNVPPPEASSDDEDWELQPGETIQYEWSNANIECDQVVDWYEEDSDGEDDTRVSQATGVDDATESDTPSQQGNGKIKCLKNHERNRVAAILLAHSYNATKLPRGIIKSLASEYGVSRHTIQRIWREAMKQYKDGGEVNVCMKKAGRVGRKRITLDRNKFTEVPLRKRTTIRSLALALNMSRSTLHRMVKRGDIKSHSNPMKPELTFSHKYQRLQWCVQSIIPQTIHTIPRFHLLQNVIHVDEKWFMMSKLSQKYYLLPEEFEPYRACRSKRFLLKIMFLAALARPLFSCDGELIWDGKIGIFPFTYEEAAKRSSKNRVAGTLEIKAMQSITQEVMREKFINELLPAIKQKWPRQLTTTVWIQQDNAKPHILEDDQQFMEACKEGGLDIRLINQPAQSPDLNVLDLGFFAAIQSLKDQAAPRGVEELVKAVQDAYYAYCPRLTNHIFITLHNCMVEIMKARGGNNYKIPHNNKQGLERQGLLSNEVEIPPQLVHATIDWLQHGYLQDEEYVLSLTRRQNQRNRSSTQDQRAQNQQQI